jgi:hypothetical protein
MDYKDELFFGERIDNTSIAVKKFISGIDKSQDIFIKSPARSFSGFRFSDLERMFEIQKSRAIEDLH